MRKILTILCLATAIAVTPMIAFSANSKGSYNPSVINTGGESNGSGGSGGSSSGSQGGTKVNGGVSSTGVVYGVGATATGASNAAGPGTGTTTENAVITTPASANTTPETAPSNTSTSGYTSEKQSGDWTKNADGTWNFTVGGEKQISKWVNAEYVENGNAVNSWFYFDKAGNMLTGWQWIDGLLYYLNPLSDGSKGRCVTNATVDGRQLNAAGQWIVEGVVQTK